MQCNIIMKRWNVDRSIQHICRRKEQLEANGVVYIIIMTDEYVKNSSRSPQSAWHQGVNCTKIKINRGTYILLTTRGAVPRRDGQRSLSVWSPLHTADADETQLSSWVASSVCTDSQPVGDSLDESEQICRQRSRVASCRRYERTRQQSWPSLQFVVLLVTSDDIRVMTSLLKKLSISIKIHVVKLLWT